MKKLSVIVPIYNEEEVLDEFYSRLVSVFEIIDLSSEVWFINDGSQDATLEKLKQYSHNDHRVGFINLSRNFGKEAALSAGLNHAEGDAVVIIDADLQDPPELILEMVRLWKEGFDVVYAQRTERLGESFMKRATSYLFYRIMEGVGRFSIPRDTGDFRLLSRRAVQTLRSLPEQNRFMKGLFAWIGYQQVALRYSRDPRFAGDSKFNYWKLWNFALDGITSFTTVPLKLATYIGIIIAFLAFAYGTFIIIRTLIFGDPVAGFPTLISVMVFIGGIQLLFLGILGEYIGRMFDETKHRPLYVIAEKKYPTCFFDATIEESVSKNID